MEKRYAVFYGGMQAGTVSVLRQGLYYRFRCWCRLPQGSFCRLRLRWGNAEENLGVLVPVKDGFGLDTKLPVSRFSEGSPEFYLNAKHETLSGSFAPIYPEEPFAYLSRLKEGYLVKKEGKVGILLK